VLQLVVDPDIRPLVEEEEEILLCHNSSTIKHNYRNNNIHGRKPEKAHAH